MLTAKAMHASAISVPPSVAGPRKEKWRVWRACSARDLFSWSRETEAGNASSGSGEALLSSLELILLGSRGNYSLVLIFILGNFIKEKPPGWWDGLVVKSMHCPCREPEQFPASIPTTSYYCYHQLSRGVWCPLLGSAGTAHTGIHK